MYDARTSAYALVVVRWSICSAPRHSLLAIFLSKFSFRANCITSLVFTPNCIIVPLFKNLYIFPHFLNLGCPSALLSGRCQCLKKKSLEQRKGYTMTLLPLTNLNRATAHPVSLVFSSTRYPIPSLSLSPRQRRAAISSRAAGGRAALQARLEEGARGTPRGHAPALGGAAWGGREGSAWTPGPAPVLAEQR